MKTESNIFTKLMSMNDTVWTRHANPWSVWTRMLTGLPMLLGSLWSIRVFGWNSLYFIVLSSLWIWLNPRLFEPPSNTMNWASKVTFGERIWLNRKQLPIPRHHTDLASILSWVSGVGFCVAAYGAVQHMLLLTLVGGVVSWFGKVWFCDRMVWLFEDMKEEHETYQSWMKE